MKHNILVTFVSVVILAVLTVAYVDAVGIVVDIPAIVGVVAPIVLLTAVIVWQIWRNK